MLYIPVASLCDATNLTLCLCFPEPCFIFISNNAFFPFGNMLKLAVLYE